MRKSNLDEMQEQKLLQIEHSGYWLAYCSLIAAIMIQAILGADFWHLIGELAVLLVICIHIAVGCLRHGLWDRKLEPNLKTNLLGSLVGAVFVAVFTYAMVSHHLKDPGDPLIAAAITGVFTFGLCFAALSICAKLYKKRRRELDTE